jgi:type II secretory pathway component HofQ
MLVAVRAVAIVIVLAAAGSARAGDLCSTGVVHRGVVIDLDVERAELRGVLRLIADTAHVNLVVGDDVVGTVSLHVKRVPWDAAACAIATLSHLELEYRDSILMVRKRG